MESIKDRGVITPAMVRKKDDGRYEMISGHRRKHASEKLGLETLRCEVVEVSRDEAIILMVDSNAQRSVILPCDKGRAFKMKLEALKRQGQSRNQNDHTADTTHYFARCGKEQSVKPILIEQIQKRHIANHQRNHKPVFVTG